MMCDNTHVEGQMLGYLIQARHMLYDLIGVKDVTVSCEVLDDVAVELPEGEVIVEQLKSVTSSANPVADRAVVLWKTLFNWMNYVKAGNLSLSNTIFKMVVISNKNTKEGKIAEGFAQAKTEESAREALNKARDELWGIKGDLKSKVPNTYGSYLKDIFDPINESVMVSIITKFEIDIYSTDYKERLREKFDHQTIFPEFADELFVYMLGWVHDRVCCLIESGKSAYITSSEYLDELRSQMRMYNQNKMIPALSNAILEENISAEVNKKDLYIQQLDLIGMELDDKLLAASDYLRTKSEEILRAKKGLITQASVKEYEDKMTRKWQGKRRLIGLSHGDSDQVKGQMLYAEMLDDSVSLDSTLPSFYGSGKMQSLANAPKEGPRIGWHPQYKELLKENNKNGK